MDGSCAAGRFSMRWRNEIDDFWGSVTWKENAQYRLPWKKNDETFTEQVDRYWWSVAQWLRWCIANPMVVGSILADATAFTEFVPFSKVKPDCLCLTHGYAETILQWIDTVWNLLLYCVTLPHAFVELYRCVYRERRNCVSESDRERLPECYCHRREDSRSTKRNRLKLRRRTGCLQISC